MTQAPRQERILFGDEEDLAMSWRGEAAPIVADVIRRVGCPNMTVLRKALAEASPWGERQNYPYKAWLAAIRHQLVHPLNKPRADPGDTQVDMFNQV